MNRSRFSNPGLIVLALLVLLPGLALAQGGGNNNRNGLMPMPVMIVTMGADQAAGGGGGTGGQLSGAFSTVIVYNNGLVLWSTNDDGTQTGNDCNIQAQTVTSERLNQLTRAIRRAGGFRAGGRVNERVQGTQLMTVTVFLDAGNSRNSVANTFSFYNATGASSRVLNILNGFFGELGIDFNNGGDDGSGTGTGS